MKAVAAPNKKEQQKHALAFVLLLFTLHRPGFAESPEHFCCGNGAAFVGHTIIIGDFAAGVQWADPPKIQPAFCAMLTKGPVAAPGFWMV